MGSIVSCWLASVAHVAAVALAFEEVEGYWTCESGDGIG